MPKLLLQRRDRVNFWSAYKVYLNRTYAGSIGFASELSLELPPGRYQMHVGSRNTREASLWINVAEHTKALEIQVEPLAFWRNWPKSWKIKLIEKGPIQLASEKDQQALKQDYRGVLVRQLFFNCLFLAFLAWPFYLFWVREDGLFLALVALGLLVLLQINVGIKKFLLRKEPKP